MPDVKDLDALAALVNVVEDSIVTNDDVPKRSTGASRIGWSNEGEALENRDVIDYLLRDPARRFGVILRNVVEDIFEIRNR